jgi:hypothetical protein
VKQVAAILVSVFFGVAGVACGESLGTVDLTFTDALGDNVTAHWNSPVWGTGSEETVAGPYRYNIANSASSPIPAGYYNGFCIDLHHNIGYGFQGTWNVNYLGAVLGGDMSTTLLKLFKAYNDATGGGMTNPQPGYFSDVLTIAVWKAIDPTSTFTGAAADRTDRPNGEKAAARADDWLANIRNGVDGFRELYAGGTVFALTHENLQTQEVTLAIANPGVIEVPEPGAFAGLLSLGLALGGVFFIRRRRA